VFNVIPFFKVSNNGAKIMNYSMENRIRRKIGFNSVIGKPLRIRWSRKFRNNLDASKPKSMGFVNQNSRFWKLAIY
jgi:hypothetical protein